MLKNRCKHMLLFVLVLVMVFAMAAPALAADATDTVAQDVEAAKAYIEQYAFFDVADELDAAIRLHVRRVYEKYNNNLSRSAAALKAARNTVRKYLEE